jgi:predicted transcriptional regulator
VDKPAWTLLSNHGHVLVCLAIDPDARMREVAVRVGITERAVQQIIRDLVDAGLVTAEKIGRRNRYTLAEAQPLRHPLEAHVRIGDFADLMR